MLINQLLFKKLFTKMKPKEFITTNKYLILASFSTISIVISSLSILSISKSVKELSNSVLSISTWADNQNECIEKTYRIDGKNTKGFPDKVWSCNGGSE